MDLSKDGIQANLWTKLTTELDMEFQSGKTVTLMKASTSITKRMGHSESLMKMVNGVKEPRRMTSGTEEFVSTTQMEQKE